MQRHKTVEDYIAGHVDWCRMLETLRSLLKAGGLEETVKWGAPCYTRGGANVVGLAAFKSHVGLWFHQGALMKDPDGVLVNAQEGRTRALRQWRFAATDEICAGRVAAYIAEAVQLADAGAKVPIERNKPLVMPAELQAALAGDAAAQRAFDALGRAKQREYAEHVAGARREATRQARLEKILPMIRAGVGLNDRYRRK